MRFLPNIKSLCLFTVAVLALVPWARAGTVLTIDDLVRPGGATAANTFITGLNNTPATSASIVESPQKTLSFAAKNGVLVAYFDPVSLVNIGDTITFSFEAMFSDFNDSGRAFRIGLFDSATATKMTADATSAAGNFSNYKGYGMNTRGASSATSDNEVYRRDPTQSALFAATSSPSIVNSGVPGLNVTNGSTYSGYLSLELTAIDTVVFTWKFGAQEEFVFTDSVNGIVTKFNTVGVFANNTIGPTATASKIAFSKFDVEYTAAVPEPSFVFVAAGAVGFLIWWRRR